MINIENNWIFFDSNEQTARKLDAVYVKSRKCWKLPNTLGALRELHKQGFNVSEYGKQKAEAREILLLEKKEKDMYGKIPEELETLRPYQRSDVHFLSLLPHAAIFNEQRTGRLDMSRFS